MSCCRVLSWLVDERGGKRERERNVMWSECSLIVNVSINKKLCEYFARVTSAYTTRRYIFLHSLFWPSFLLITLLPGGFASSNAHKMTGVVRGGVYIMF
jgi:hypothetical protein